MTPCKPHQDSILRVRALVPAPGQRRSLMPARGRRRQRGRARRRAAMQARTQGGDGWWGRQPDLAGRMFLHAAWLFRRAPDVALPSSCMALPLMLRLRVGRAALTLGRLALPPPPPPLQVWLQECFRPPSLCCPAPPSCAGVAARVCVERSGAAQAAAAARVQPAARVGKGCEDRSGAHVLRGGAWRGGNSNAEGWVAARCLLAAKHRHGEGGMLAGTQFTVYAAFLPTLPPPTHPPTPTPPTHPHPSADGAQGSVLGHIGV